MKLQFYPSKSYSWLQFPVNLNRRLNHFDGHLTLKFFGEAAVDHHVIAEKLAITPDLVADDFLWEPRFWSSPHDHANYYVLAFVKYPTVLDSLRRPFAIVKDQYIPWTPHITVTKEIYLLVEDEGLTPIECGLEFGEIELCLGGPNL